MHRRLQVPQSTTPRENGVALRNEIHTRNPRSRVLKLSKTSILGYAAHDPVRMNITSSPKGGNVISYAYALMARETYELQIQH